MEAMPDETVRRERMPRYPALTGWRGISILVVLASHWLPLGPKRFGFNEAAGLFGMALFFCLSGFLIASTLIYDDSVKSFMIRRLCRIVPLTWVCVAIAMLAGGLGVVGMFAHLFFFENVPPYFLVDHTAHLWSLCVEIHFYFAMAALYAVLRRRMFGLLPYLCIGITLLRVLAGRPVSIFTPFRVDEILVGAWIATCVHRDRLADVWGQRTRFDLTTRVPMVGTAVVPAALLALSCLPEPVALDYLRPYFAAWLVATSLVAVSGPVFDLLRWKWLSYVAEISFAVYIFHGPMTMGWMGSGSKAIKYAKRVPVAAATFGTAHLSTRHFEAWWIRFGRRLSDRVR